MFTPLKKPCVRHGEFVNKNCTHILFLLRMGFQPFRQALLVVLAVVFVLVVLVVLVLMLVLTLALVLLLVGDKYHVCRLARC